jgi:hypothetical protein
MIDLEELLPRFEQNAAAIAGLVAGIGSEEAHWRGAPGKWSIVELINHLHDEEWEDFRQRLDYTLHRPGEKWPLTDPERWVTDRDYQSRELAPSLDAFLEERRRSIEWLRGLRDPRWDNFYPHPAGIDVKAGDLIFSWLTHDYLHIRQLIKLRYHYLATLLPEYDSGYSGGKIEG